MPSRDKVGAAKSLTTRSPLPVSEPVEEKARTKSISCNLDNHDNPPDDYNERAERRGGFRFDIVAQVSDSLWDEKVQEKIVKGWVQAA